MRETHTQLNLPPVQVQPSSQHRESTSTAQVQELSLVGLLADAVASTGCSEKEAAIAQGYEPAYWSRIKAGEKAAHLDRVSRLPERVQRAFVTRWASQLRLRVTDGDDQKHAAANLLKAAADFLAGAA